MKMLRWTQEKSRKDHTRNFTIWENACIKDKNVGNIQRYTPDTLYPKAPLYNIIIIVDTVLRQKRKFKHEK